MSNVTELNPIGFFDTWEFVACEWHHNEQSLIILNKIIQKKMRGLLGCLIKCTPQSIPQYYDKSPKIVIQVSWCIFSYPNILSQKTKHHNGSFLLCAILVTTFSSSGYIQLKSQWWTLKICRKLDLWKSLKPSSLHQNSPLNITPLSQPYFDSAVINPNGQWLTRCFSLSLFFL